MASRDYVVIYRSSIRTRSGRVIYARDYGLKAFKLVIPRSRFR